jgi:peroxiredoxin Q/BCP
MSFDTPAANKAFAGKFGFRFRLLSDAERKAAVAYGAADDASARTPKRMTFVVGPDGRIEQAIATQDPAGQAGELLEVLKPQG